MEITQPRYTLCKVPHPKNRFRTGDFPRPAVALPAILFLLYFQCEIFNLNLNSRRGKSVIRSPTERENTNRMFNVMNPFFFVTSVRNSYVKSCTGVNALSRDHRVWKCWLTLKQYRSEYSLRGRWQMWAHTNMSSIWPSTDTPWTCMMPDTFTATTPRGQCVTVPFATAIVPMLTPKVLSDGNSV